MSKWRRIKFMAIALLMPILQSCNERTVDKKDTTNTNDKVKQTSGESYVNKEEATKQTTKNMLDAYKGETTAHFKYVAYSKKAEEEGHPEVALLFKAASVAELIHATNHKVILVRMGENIPEINPEYKVNSTLENLKESINGESYEFNTMYPKFIKDANDAGNYMAQISLTYAYKVEQKHRDFYIDALASYAAGTDSNLPKIYFLCPTCGNTYATTAPSRCEISLTDSKLFIQITSL
jgi:rubrerythrin